MDLLPLRQVDNRRLEVVVDGLPLFRGAQLAIDTTMVSPVLPRTEILGMVEALDEKGVSEQLLMATYSADHKRLSIFMSGQ